MERRTARRSMHYGRTIEERPIKDDNDYKNNGDTNNLIADMAQGFIQAQTKVDSGNDKEIISLLEKLNSNLEEMKSSNDDSKKNTSSDAGKNTDGSLSKKLLQAKLSEQLLQSGSTEQGDKELLQELKTLVSTMLQGKSNSEDNSSNPQTDDTKKSDMKQQQQDSMAVQTVSQVLAQTQYELANELETSLQKLKEVISKSEKVATNISHLLSKETKKKS
ncbi:hypothetical protein [Pelosinus baikalensis]|uniref:Uncharacterized protein n=1 Tax=Pelosinus baikalensis TaxID=2892015 RepID=A0ABS8HN60_9FIRM|nr:hypothetical protein [Pelosinus baikalensis]MCC5464367.1 hypothetical protein [Pelosinus baikalensis]